MPFEEEEEDEEEAEDFRDPEAGSVFFFLILLFSILSFSEAMNFSAAVSINFSVFFQEEPAVFIDSAQDGGLTDCLTGCLVVRCGGCLSGFRRKAF